MLSTCISTHHRMSPRHLFGFECVKDRMGQDLTAPAPPPPKRKEKKKRDSRKKNNLLPQETDECSLCILLPFLWQNSGDTEPYLQFHCKSLAQQSPARLQYITWVFGKHNCININELIPGYPELNLTKHPN